MLWAELKDYFVREDKSETMEDTGFISYCPKDKYMMQVEATRNDDWYTATYLQICRNEETTDDVFVIQLEGLPEDPTNILIGTCADHTNIPVKIYKRILKDVD